jgi:hypothetical protein
VNAVQFSRRLTVIGALALVLVLVIAGSAYAGSTDISNNLANDWTGFVTVSDTQWLAQAFTTTLNNYIVTEVRLRLCTQDQELTGTYAVKIYSVESGLPKTATVNITTTGSISALGECDSSGGSVVQFPVPSGTLSKNTEYYLVVLANGTDTLSWAFTDDPSGTGFPSNYTSSSNGNTGWSAPSTAEGQQQMQIVASGPTAVTLRSFAASAPAGDGWAARRTEAPGVLQAVYDALSWLGIGARR